MTDCRTAAQGFISAADCSLGSQFAELEEFCASADIYSLVSLQRQLKKLSLSYYSTGEISEEYGYHPFFHKVCMNEDVTFEVVKHLLDVYPWVAKSNTESLCPDGRTEAFPIHMACWNEHCPGSVIELLLKHGSDRALGVSSIVNEGVESELDEHQDDYIKGLPLHYYLIRDENVEFDIVKKLVQTYPQALLNNDNESSILPIHVALSNPHIETNTLYNIIGYMLELEPSTIRSLNYIDRTLLSIACRNESMTLELFLLMFNKWPDAVRPCYYNLPYGYYNLPIHELCNNKNMDETASINILRYMLNHDISVLRMIDGMGVLPFHLAASTRSSEFCKEIINVDPELAKTKSCGMLPIHYACKSSKHAGTILYLLDLYPEGTNIRCGNDWLPIHAAAWSGNVKAIEILLMHDPDTASKVTGAKAVIPLCSPLHMAIRYCHSEKARIQSVQILYDAYPDAIRMRDSNSNTPMDLFVMGQVSPNQSLVNFLWTQLNYVRKAEDTTALFIRNENDLLPLHQALMDKAPLGSIKLLVRGNPAAINTDQPLHLACQFSSAKVVQYLIGELDDGVLDQLDTNKNSILHYACLGGNLEVVKYLLNNHASMVASSTVNAENKLPIHLLCEAGKLGTVDCESSEYIEMIWQMLLANPEAIMA